MKNQQAILARLFVVLYSSMDNMSYYELFYTGRIYCGCEEACAKVRGAKVC